MRWPWNKADSELFDLVDGRLMAIDERLTHLENMTADYRKRADVSALVDLSGTVLAHATFLQTLNERIGKLDEDQGAVETKLSSDIRFLRQRVENLELKVYARPVYAPVLPKPPKQSRRKPRARSTR